MDKDSASIAPSEATTLVGAQSSQQRTTLTGKPIQYQHDNFTSIMMADGGGFGGIGAATNLLPPGFTDKSLVRVPVKMSDIEGSHIQPTKKKGFLRKLSSSSGSNEEIKILMMSREDYLKYWIKGDNGKFLDSVQEPPGGRRAWVENQVELNKKWKEKDPSL